MSEREEELRRFMYSVERYASSICPYWLTPNSTGVGIEPGHNLDLLKVWFDFTVSRTDLLRSETPTILKDPSEPELRVIK